MAEREAEQAMRWYRVDLHIHTPASEDYAEKHVTYLDILREAERRGLDVIAITDHNTIAGYEAIFDEIEFLERLEARNRLNDQERAELDEYRRLLSKITVLPGFELTTSFGSHVLGIFSPKMPDCIARIKAILNELGVPYDKIPLGTTSVPGTKGFLEAYKIINEAGGLVIAAHINTPTGVLAFVNNLPTGAARVGATQSPYLHALEFASFHSTHLQGFANPRWYDGTNLGYERRMHCIQGSDAHRLVQDPTAQTRRWGIGDRPTELLLPEPTFEAILDLFRSADFDRVRVPYVSDVAQYNRIVDARTAGSSDHQILCPRCTGNLTDLCRHVVALANSGGGVIYVGLDPDPSAPIVGVPDAANEMRAFQIALSEAVFPQLEWSVDIVKFEGRDIVQIEVQDAPRKPCCVIEDGAKTIYVRREGQTCLATHADIVEMIHHSDEGSVLATAAVGAAQMLLPGVEQPKSGVEIAGQALRGEVEYFRLVDLRTNRESYASEQTATSVWLYAIKSYLAIRHRLQDLTHLARWHGQIGLWRIYRENEYYDQWGRVKCDLVFRDEQGRVQRIFFAVAVNWLNSGWDALFEVEPPPGGVTETEPSSQRVRWRGNLGVEALYSSPQGLLCDLVFRNRQGKDIYYRRVPCATLPLEWASLLRVELPRSGLEVVEVHQNGSAPLYKFYNLGNKHVESRLWTPEMLKDGSLRHYALRMHIEKDRPLDDSQVCWMGNLGALRRSYTTVDLVYRDPEGKDHIYYGARWADLSGEWLQLMEE